MIVKKTKQLGNFKRGINLYIPKKKISAAPEPTAVLISGAEIFSSNGNYVWSGDFVNGKRQYFFSNNEIYWNGSQWNLYDDSEGDIVYSSLNLIAWEAIGEGDAPTGTLSYS
jgi:hypothetical protein